MHEMNIRKKSDKNWRKPLQKTKLNDIVSLPTLREGSKARSKVLRKAKYKKFNFSSEIMKKKAHFTLGIKHLRFRNNCVNYKYKS